MAVEGSTTSDIFETYVPTYVGRYVGFWLHGCVQLTSWMMDNLTAHTISMNSHMAADCRKAITVSSS